MKVSSVPSHKWDFRRPKGFRGVEEFYAIMDTLTDGTIDSSGAIPRAAEMGFDGLLMDSGRQGVVGTRGALANR